MKIRLRPRLNIRAISKLPISYAVFLNYKYDICSNLQSEGKGKTLGVENRREAGPRVHGVTGCPSVKSNNPSIKAEHTDVRLTNLSQDTTAATEQIRRVQGNIAASLSDFSREQRPAGENRL